jgi:O-antigen/teichoic acid export membrane protein
LLLQGAGVITGVVLARSLGAAGRGELAAAILWPSVFAALATLGLQESATFHMARHLSSAGRIVGSGLLLVFLQSLVFTAACAALLPLVLGHYRGATLTAGFLYLLYIPMNAVGTLLVGVLLGGLHYKSFNALRLMIGLAPVIVMAVLLGFDALTVWSVVVGYTLSMGVCVVAAFVLVARTRPGRLGVDREAVQSMFAYGIRSHASNSSSQLNQRLDQLIISAFLPARQLGLYVAATTLTSLTGMIGYTVAFIALPSVARLSPGPERTLVARRLISMTLLASAVVSVPIVIFAPFVIKLFFGPSFAAAVDATRILALAIIGYGASRSIEAVLRAVGRPFDAGIAEFIALGVTVASLAVLIPLAGIVGAAVSSLLAYGVAGYWMTRRAAAALDARWFQLLVPDREAFTMLHDTLRRARADER